MLSVAVAWYLSDGNAISYGTSGFVDDVMCSHNRAVG